LSCYSVGGAVTPAKILLSFCFSYLFSICCLTTGYAGVSAFFVYYFIWGVSATVFVSIIPPAFLAADASFNACFSAFTYSLYLFFSSSVRVAPYSLSRAAFSCFDSSVDWSEGGIGIYTATVIVGLSNHIVELRLTLCFMALALALSGHQFYLRPLPS